MLTLEQKKHAIEKWILTRSITSVRRSFRFLPGFHSKSLPPISTLRNIVNKFEVHGILSDRRKGKKSVINSHQINRVKRLYREKQLISLRSASKRLQISTRRVRNILRLTLLKKAFKAKVRLRLTESQRKSRVEASQVLLDKQNILAHTWFTDESWFYSDGIAQKKNQHYWALSKDAVKPVEKQLVPIKVMVWGAVSAKGLIGPYFFHKNGAQISVNQHTYQDCVVWFVEELKSRRKLARSYFMQDGATPHTAKTTRTLLGQIFANRVVGKHFPISWPPYSPDLTPADFWLWPTLKRMIFNKRNQPFTSIGSLKKAITFAFNQLKRVNLQHLKPAVVKRLKLCREKKGFRF